MYLFSFLNFNYNAVEPREYFIEVKDQISNFFVYQVGDKDNKKYHKK